MSGENDKLAINNAQALMMLGEIRGLVQGIRDGQDEQNRRMDAFEKRVDGRFEQIDGRLRQVEQKAAVAGAISGGAVAVGTALIVEGVKQWLLGGSNGN